MTATAQIVDGKLLPINKTEPTQPLVVTGQYLYDQFVQAGEEQKSRMAVIRDLVTKADALQIKGAVDTMVKLAHEKDKAAGVPEKERGPKRNTAMNVRTFFQQIWGALKYAEEQMRAQGYSEETGWLEARSMAKVALDRAGKTWQGYDVPTAAQREQKALLRRQKGETDAMLEATKDTPRALNESYSSWQARIGEVAEKYVESARMEAAEKAAASYVEKIMKTDGEAVAFRVMCKIADILNIELGTQSELSDDDVAARMKAAALAEEEAPAPETETESAE
jgi:hypothetical protein